MNNIKVIKVIKTSVNQTIQVELPEDYIVDLDLPPSLNTFFGEFKIPLLKAITTLQKEKQ